MPTWLLGREKPFPSPMKTIDPKIVNVEIYPFKTKIRPSDIPKTAITRPTKII